MKRHLCWLLLVNVFPLAALAQQPSAEKAAPTATITGHVYCADTNAPARMATVMLEAANSVDEYSSDAKDSIGLHLTSVQTLLDGSFVLPHIAPGSYYVLASAPGYVSPLTAVADTDSDRLKPDKATREKYRQLIPRVTVQGSLGASVDIRLERGAAISGTILYDDGSPATGLAVQALVLDKQNWLPLQNGTTSFRPDTRTDDQGNFRISGLPARAYLLQVQLHLTKQLTDVNGSGSASSSVELYTLPIYTGSVFRTSEAKPFTVKIGEERPDENIDIPLAKLHAVGGTIIAARDSHEVNAGELVLLHADDKSELARVHIEKEDPLFTFTFVPEGDYILKATGAADVEYEETANPPGTMPPTTTKENTTHRYGDAEQPIHVEGEIVGVTITVPELVAAPSPPGASEPPAR